ncbi:MAG: oligosaccharide flippase family protein [Sedimentisphaerales bacterium]
MSIRRKVILNAGSNWMSQFVNAAIVLIFIRIIPRSLGWESYGVWALLSTGLRYPMILENAFSLSTNRFAAFYHNDKEQLNRLVSASFVILLFMALLTIAAAVLLSFFVSDIFAAITSDLAFEAQITCILVGVTIALRIVEAAFNGTLMGFQYHTRYNSITVMANILRIILIVILLRYWRSMIAVQLAFAITASVSLTAVIHVTRKSIPGLKIELSKVDRKIIRELFRYSSHAAARSGSMIFMYSTLALLIGKIGTAENVSVYDIASRISGFINSLLAGAHNVFLPAVTKLFAESQAEKIKSVIKKGTNISAVITCAILIMLFVYGKEILSLLLRDMFLPEMLPVLWIMLISIIPRGFFGIWIPSLAGMGHLREMTIAALAAVVGAITLEILLLGGSVPVPMAPAIAQAIALWAYIGLWLPFYGTSKCDMALYEYLRDGLLGSLKASVVSMAVLFMIINFLAPRYSFHWMLMFVMSGLIVLASFTIISLRSESKWAINMLKSRLGYQS